MTLTPDTPMTALDCVRQTPRLLTVRYSPTCEVSFTPNLAIISRDGASWTWMDDDNRCITAPADAFDRWSDDEWMAFADDALAAFHRDLADVERWMTEEYGENHE